jgi:Cd2+/Zn2+-exporting ATPase
LIKLSTKLLNYAKKSSRTAQLKYKEGIVMSRKQKRTLIRIIISLFLFAAAYLANIFNTNERVRFFAFLIPYAIIGWDILWRAARNILHGQIFDENFLMAIATIGALTLREYPEAAAVMLFYQIGEWFQQYAIGKSRRSISELMNIRPDYANIEAENGLVQIDPYELNIGDTIVIKPGEKIPLDSVIIEGRSTLNTSALTGESVPKDVCAGDTLISGCVNMTGLLKAKVTKTFENSTVAKILDLVENSSSKKAHAENFITKFARYYTPLVVISAALIAVIPSLIFGEWSEWVQRALIFLVVSCPCALVISIPLSFFGGIGGASKHGILVKGGNYLETLANAEIIVFDKTGTLTKGNFIVTEINPAQISEKDLLELAALSESYSSHPISESLKEAYGKTIDTSRISDAEEIAGQGVRAVVDGKAVYTGNDKLMRSIGIQYNECRQNGTIVHVSVDNVYAGYIIISDEIKPDAIDAVKTLKQQGIRTVMLTGDRREAGEFTAKRLGIDEVHAELLPDDKVTEVEKLISTKSPRGKLAFVGDGINDAPVLACADIGIAMGGLGSDAAIEAADIVLMDDAPSKIALAMKISRKTLKIVKQNIVFALSIKFIILLLGALGMATMWEAVLGDVGVAFLAILNASRALKTKK